MSVQAIENMPSPAELAARARAMAPAIRARCREAEQRTRLPEATIDEFRAAELYRTMQPKRFGGFEYDFGAMIDISYEIGRACASTAWVTGLYVVHNWILGMFADEAQHDVWDDTPWAVISGSYPPSGKATRVDGGFRLSGAFGFSSGCDTSQWSICGSVIPPKRDGEKPKPGFMLIPAKDYKIDQTSWDTVGLRGSGTKTLHIDDAFVPEHRILYFEDASSPHAPGTAVNKDPVFQIPFLALVPYSLATPSIGAVAAAIDDFIDGTSGRATRGAVKGAGHKMIEFATVQLRIAEAAANVDAARLLQKRDCRETYEEITRNGIVSMDTRMRNRRNHAFVTRAMKQSVDGLFTALGGHGLYMTTEIQRAWRDVHAIAAHVSLNWDAVGSMYGQHRFGLEPQGQY